MTNGKFDQNPPEKKIRRQRPNEIESSLIVAHHYLEETKEQLLLVNRNGIKKSCVEY